MSTAAISTKRKVFDLSKKAHKVIAKRAMINVRSRWGFAIDVSGSMKDLYRRGVVQATMERFLALAIRMDDDSEMETWAFSDQTTPLGGVTPDTANEYVRDHIIRAKLAGKWKGTYYLDAIRMPHRAWFPSLYPRQKTILDTLLGRPGKVPALPLKNPPAEGKAVLMLVTDGANDDRDETQTFLRWVENSPFYVNFVPIGNPSDFQFLHEMAERYQNVGISWITDIEKISDENLYETVLSEEMVRWFKAGTAAPVITAPSLHDIE